MLCVGLADKYGVPVSYLLRHWSIRELNELVAFSQIRERRQGKITSAISKAKVPKPKQQTPEQMLAALDSL